MSVTSPTRLLFKIHSTLVGASIHKYKKKRVKKKYSNQFQNKQINKDKTPFKELILSILLFVSVINPNEKVEKTSVIRVQYKKSKQKSFFELLFKMKYIYIITI